MSVTYIISGISKSLAFEWIAEKISSVQISFILLNPEPSTPIEQWLEAHNKKFFFVKYSSKKDFLSAFWKVKKHLEQLHTDIVHCHLQDACLVGLLAAKSLDIRKRIFTRHHATMNYHYYPRAVYYDKIINFLASDAIAISKNVQEVLIREGFKPSKIHLVHHGFDFNFFEQTTKEQTQLLQKKYNPLAHQPVIGVIARFIHLKGIQYSIAAFKKLLSIYPNAHLVLANASGDYANELRIMLSEIPTQNYTEIIFEENLPALYRLFDVYVHTPIDAHVEAFGQTYVEALALGIPSVFTLSGVAAEFVVHKKNAFVVPFQNASAIVEGVQYLLENSDEAKRITTQGKKDIADFHLDLMIEKLQTLYNA